MAHRPNTETHRANRLLAALEREDFAYLEPHLEIIDLNRQQVLYEAGEAIRYTYCPRNAVVSLVNVLEDGGSVEVAMFGREGVFGLISALYTRESFGRYVMQIRTGPSILPIGRTSSLTVWDFTFKRAG